ncbi:LacI family DNA-binding transcriptional regulator [Cronobacter turicensis]|uniref:LacI family DNA-binding transcriptional regulator n=1 Tax=Cronobacter turicensis TaxID=413502 RepID=UPI0024C41855|nr:LacI family DNA-binding transcriptional regulator [Cronobacter turicensis]MDK1236923.1 LacI family DNA-binding transcriptional regulator [Cronobacter turicensis]
MMRKNKVTMNDIARAAGVSQATVSLVINQSRNIKLSDETRQRVMAVAAELGYDRIPAIHSPRNQEEIALLISSLQSFDPFIDAISQAREAAWRNQVLLTVYDYGDDEELARNIIRQLEKRNCVGVILASPVTTVIDMTPFHQCTSLPLVLLNQSAPHSPQVPSFVPDDYANAFLLTRHLIAQGARRIAHITGEEWMEATRQRLAGYLAALKEADIAAESALILQTNWQFSESFQATQALLALTPRPDAIFCASDWLAIGCYQALATHGVRIPDDIWVAGYDDQKISEQLTPALTSIQLPYSELGRMAVEYLCNGEDAIAHVTLTGQLRTRISTSRIDIEK